MNRWKYLETSSALSEWSGSVIWYLVYKNMAENAAVDSIQREIGCLGVGVFKKAKFPLETSQIWSVGKVQNNMKYDGLG